MMYRNRRLWIVLGTLALFACGVWYRFSHPTRSNQIRLAIVGPRWFDPLGRNLRIYDSNGHRIGEYWLDIDDVWGISASTRGRWFTVWSRVFEPDNHFVQYIYEMDSPFWVPIILEHVTSISWSPDEEQIALTYQPPEADPPISEIRLAPATCLDAGHDCVQESQFMRVGGWVSWSPDGTSMAYVSSEGKITLLDLETQSERILPHKAREACWRTSWSPTGRYIGYLCNWDLFVYDLDQDIEREIPLMPDLSPGAYLWLPGSEDELIINGCRVSDVCQGHFPLWLSEVDIASALYEFQIGHGPIDRLLQVDDQSIRDWTIVPASP